MAEYQYQAVDRLGKRVEGTIAVARKSEVYRHLETLGCQPITVTSANGSVKPEKEVEAGSQTLRLNQAQLIFFTEELADLLESGIPLEQSLGILEERKVKGNLPAIAGRLRTRIRDGATVAAALKGSSPSFDDLYCNMVAAGEMSGSLPGVLRRLHHNLVIMNELQSKVVQAMIYPAFMIGACILLMAVFMTVLVPQLSGLIAKSGQELPLATALLIRFNTFMGENWWFLVILLTTAVLGFRYITHTPAGRLWWDEYKLKIPLFGPVFNTRYLAQFSHGLSSLVSNGVHLLSGLKLMARATTNTYLHHTLKTVVLQVGDGGTLSQALGKTGSFPKLMVDIIVVGEQTGNLGKALNKAAQRYDKELDKRIKRLTAMISPIIIIFLAVVVSIVAYAIVTSIFQSISGIGGV